jgi:general secretion pathway protein D
VVVAVSVAGVFASAFAQTPPGASDATVALNFQDVELPVLAKFVSEVTGRNFIVDDRVRGKVTIISPTRITPDEAYAVFQSVLQVKGFTTVQSGTFVKIVPARDARETAVPTGAARDGDAVVTRLLPLAHADASALVPVVTPLVSKDGLVTAAPQTNTLVVVDAAANVERVAGLLRELDVPASERTLAVVPLRFAAADELAVRVRDAVGTNGGLRVTADARTNALVLAGPPDEVRRAKEVAGRLDRAVPASSARLNVYRLKYADAERMVRVLARLIGQPVEPEPAEPPRGSSFMREGARRASLGWGYDGGMGGPPPPPIAPAAAPATTGTADAVPLEAPVRVTADAATNALVVSATPADWNTLRRVIEELDVRRRQVFVEAIILEATVEKTRALGFEFQAGGSGSDGAGLAAVDFGRLAATTGAITNPTSLAGLVLAAASNERVRLPDGRMVPAQTVLLTALERDSDLNVLSAPTMVTTDNEEAEIVVGRNVPFVASRATSSSNLENLFTTIERHDVGITLRITPQITGDDFVRLVVFEEVSDIDPTVTAAVGDPNLVGPTTSIRSASTAIAARDGQTVVIGGLLSDKVLASEQRVPWLGRIPVLGAFFRRNDQLRLKTNLLVFLTPHIIGSDAVMADNSVRERERMRAALPPRLRRHPKLEGRSWDAPAPDTASPRPEDER